MGQSYRELAWEWLEQDPDPQTREELSRLLEAHADAELADRFGSRLEFGTAGLRGELGAGPNRMNRVTVMRAAAGVARWAGAGQTVVVGYDARHRSEDFARDTAAVLAGAGCVPLMLPRPLPTPVLAFAVRARGAGAGVMVTASHNPPQDNGCKVYVGGTGADAGSQIAPPMDTEISAAIDNAPAVGELELGEHWDVLGEDLVEEYIATIAGLPLGTDRDIQITYTPMHGVGAQTLATAFSWTGFPAPRVVLEQVDPDPVFPTLPFPNPEEPGAMDLALATSRQHGSELILANDPDSDRLAVAVPGHGLLTGDELGGLLAEHILAHTSHADRLVATTIVSAGLLAKIAKDYGVGYAETLTGFKWLVRAGTPDRRPVFCYEEALGYCVADDTARPVADKDGISAALMVAAIAARAKRSGRTLLDLVDDQARRYGLHLTTQLSLRADDTSVLTRTMRQLRAQPPGQLAQWQVEGVDDFLEGRDDLPPTDALRFRLSGPAEARVTLRPSGTEPKLKAYLEVVHPVHGDTAHLGPVRSRADAQLGVLKDAVAELFPRSS